MRDTTSRSAHRPGRRVAALLVHFIVVCLVPVLVFTTPGVASAAVKVSGTTRGEFAFEDYGGLVFGQWASCSFQAFYSVGGQPNRNAQTVKVNSGNCETGPGQNIEGAHLSLTFNGQTLGAATDCTGNAVGTLAEDTEAFGPLSAAMTGLNVPDSDLCQVSEFCWELSKTYAFPPGNTDVWSGCESLPMGPPTPAGNSDMVCSIGSVGQPVSTLDYSTVRYASGSWRITRRITVPVTVSAGQSFKILPYAAGALPATGTTWAPASSHPGSGGAVDISTSGTYVYSQEVSGGQPTYNSNTSAPPVGWWESNGFKFAGVQFLGTPQEDLNYEWTPDAAGTYAGNSAGPLGSSDPALCNFWFGPKVIDNAHATADIPAGAVADTPSGTGGDDPEPAPDSTPPVTPVGDDEGCTDGFTIWNPVTWASAGFCEVVSALWSVLKALGGVVKAITGIPAAILKGLSGVLETLFVPGDGYEFGVDDSGVEQEVMGGGVGEWRDLFASAPGGAAAAGGSTGVGAMRVVDPGDGGGGGGCQGPTFALPEFMTNAGMPAQLAPLEACTGTMATLASWTRLIAMVLMGVTCLVKCMEMVTASAGIMRQTSIMSSYDWSNAVIKR